VSRKKDKLIETLEHGPFKAGIRMNGMTGEFYCDDYPDETYRGSLPDVRKWTRDRLRAFSKLAWQPIMMVHFDDEDDHVNNLRRVRLEMQLPSRVP
jgi:hypothetical protein